MNTFGFEELRKMNLPAKLKALPNSQNGRNFYPSPIPLGTPSHTKTFQLYQGHQLFL